MQDRIKYIQLLTPTEAQTVRNTVHALEKHWTKRHVAFPIYTLGAVNYMDGLNKQKTEHYFQKVKKNNPILRENLGWLYDRLRDKLSDFVGTSVSYTNTFALPGFHIHGACKLFKHSFFSCHFDRFNRASWVLDCDRDDRPLPLPELRPFDLNSTLSFTVAIALPKSGGGLNTWDLHYSEVKDRNLPHSKVLELAKTCKKQFHPYHAGSMVVHSGHLLHQMASTPEFEPDNERIALQGHGVFWNGQWKLYW